MVGKFGFEFFRLTEHQGSSGASSHAGRLIPAFTPVTFHGESDIADSNYCTERAHHGAGPTTHTSVSIEPHDAGDLVFHNPSGDAGINASRFQALSALQRYRPTSNTSAFVIDLQDLHPMHRQRILLHGGDELSGFRMHHCTGNLAGFARKASLDATDYFFHRSGISLEKYPTVTNNIAVSANHSPVLWFGQSIPIDPPERFRCHNWR
jgi:hypothetical protein